MKKNILFISLAVLVLSVVFAFKTSLGVLPFGSDLPKADVKMKDVSGKEISMKEAKKKNGLLVMFTCNTCPYVVKNQERTKAICDYAIKNEIGVILLNSNEAQRGDQDSFEAMQAYAKAQEYKWFYVLDKDNTAADAFGANRTPECYLFNSGLKLSYSGAIDDNPSDADNVKRQHLKEAINELTSGKDISIKESRSMGCGIKRKG